MDVEWTNWNDQWENWGPVECSDSWATDMQCVGGLQVCYCPTGATFLASGYYPAGTVCHQANLAQAWLESTSKATHSLDRDPRGSDHEGVDAVVGSPELLAKESCQESSTGGLTNEQLERIATMLALHAGGGAGS